MKRNLVFDLLSLFLLVFISCNNHKSETKYNVKYEPPNGKVIVFVGQDNESVGGNNRFNNCYVDHIGIPSGITQYIRIDTTNANGLVRELNIESIWEAYYPGDEYVYCLGYSYWGRNPNSDTLAAFNFAEQKNKPLFIAEIAPRGHCIKNPKSGQDLWNKWYTDFFNHVSNNLEYVKATSYINCDWDIQEMWEAEVIVEYKQMIIQKIIG